MTIDIITRKLASYIKSERVHKRIIKKKGGVYILMYHSISENNDVSSFPYDISVSSFKHQLSTLDDIVEFIHPADLHSMGSSPDTDQPQVLLTFDDGYYNNYSIAYPVLSDLDIPALFFLPTKFIHESFDTFLNWSQVHELANADLIGIGSHTCSHWNLEALNYKDIIDEIQKSKKN